MLYDAWLAPLRQLAWPMTTQYQQHHRSEANLDQVVLMWVQELEIAEKEGRRLRREGESKKVKDEEDAGPSGPPDSNGPAPMDTQMSGLDERQVFPAPCTQPYDKTLPKN